MAALILRRSIYRHWICARPTARRISSLPPSPTRPSHGPWLLIEDRVEENNMLFNFYSVSYKNVIQKRKRIGKDCIVVGSTHGWLALYKPLLDYCKGTVAFKIFLYDPSSGRHVNLPQLTVETLPIHIPIPANKSPRNKTNRPKKVILSSPLGWDVTDECRAIMSYGPEDRLAYCCPKHHSTVWTPIGDLENDPFDEHQQQQFIRYTDSPYPRTYYKDFVYSSTRKQLFCINKFDVECWDLSDTLSPKMVWKTSDKICLSFGGLWFYLVFAERSNRLFLVERKVFTNVVPYGIDDELDAPGDGPYQTVDFLVSEIIVDPNGYGDFEEVVTRRMKGTLDDMAFFIGSVGDGFVIEKDEMEKNVEPNCIYFTDPKELTPPSWYKDVAYGGHDLGVFSYDGSRAFSSCYKYPCDFRSIRRIQPTPTWYMIPA